MAAALRSVAHPVDCGTRTRVGMLFVVLLLGITVGACSSGSRATVSPTPAVTVAPAVQTPTPSPTATPTPTPIATATEVPASAASLTARAASTHSFPPPPTLDAAPAADAGGIARMVSASLALDNYVEIVRVVDNQMQTPADGSYAVGWYPEYGAPGEPGNAIFTAHETWNHYQGPFYSVHLAQAGDEIDVVMVDGRRYRYTVFSRTRYAVDTMPMGDIIWPAARPSDEQWITLITCGGRIVYDGSGFGEYLDRDVVVARRVE